MSKRGQLVNIGSLPWLSIQEEGGKIKAFQLECLNLEPISFSSNINTYDFLRNYLWTNVEVQPTKKLATRCRLLDSNGNNIGRLLLAHGLATIDQQQLKQSPEDVQQIYKNVQKIQKQSQLRNCIAKPELLRNIRSSLKNNVFSIESVKSQIILRQNETYLPVVLTNLEISVEVTDDERYTEFLKKNRQIEVELQKPKFDIVQNRYVVYAKLPVDAECEILQNGWANINPMAEPYIQGATLERYVKAKDEAERNFKGIWKNHTNLLELIYVQDSFLATVVGVDQATILTVKNVDNGQTFQVQIPGLDCPVKAEIGAFEARQFARKQALDKEFNVYSKGKPGHFTKASLVRVSDSQRFDRLLVSNGWAKINPELQDQKLLNLQKKAIESRIGLHSNKIGKVIFNDLSKSTNKETKEQLRELSDQINHKKKHDKIKHQHGVIMGFKKNNLYEVKLNDFKKIVNVQLEELANLEVRLQIKEFDEFKEKSANYIRDYYLQRDIDVVFNQFNEALCTFSGKIFKNGKDIAEGLLSEGLAYTQEWNGQKNKNYLKLEEQAKQKQKGLWNEALSKFRTDSQISSVLLETTEAIITVVEPDCSYFHYQPMTELHQLQKEIFPQLKNLKKLENKHIRVGNMCAAPYEDGNMYRAKILPTPKKSTTSCYVCYVDYGNFATVNKSDLYELPEELMKIEGVAKRGRLYAIGKLMSEDKQAQRNIKRVMEALLDREVKIVPEFGGTASCDLDAVWVYPIKSATDDVRKSINIELWMDGVVGLSNAAMRELPADKAEKIRALKKRRQDKKSQ